MDLIGALARGLKPSASIAAVVGWNVLCGIGIYLNGGLGRLKTVPSVLMMFVACTAMTIFALATVMSERWRRIVLRESADVDSVVSAMLFLALIATILALGALYTAMQLST